MIRAWTKALVRDSIRLQASISTIFALLILPALGAVIAFSYHENHRNLSDLSQTLLDRARDEAITSVSALLDPVASTLRIVAAVEASQPGYFRQDSSGDVLYHALLSADHIDAVYTSFDMAITGWLRGSTTTAGAAIHASRPPPTGT
jgi:hypothetical protein